MAKMNGKAKEALDRVVTMFESGDVPAAIAHSVLNPAPMAKWSYLNRLACYVERTSDARGFNQWKNVGRSVKKGSKAIYILAPTFVKAKVEKREIDESGRERVVEAEESRMVGFHAIPVFRVEDTEGEPVDYQTQAPPVLANVAEAWGIKITFEPGGNGYHGAFSPDKNAIRLATADEDVFYHELSHAAHGRILERQGKKLTAGQDAVQEIVAEMSAAILARLYGCRTENEGRSFKYVKAYVDSANLTVEDAVCKTLKMVEQVIVEITAVAEVAA